MNVLTAKAISLTVCCCQQSKWKIWWRHIYVIWRNYLNLAVFKGVRGTPRQDLEFRAHEMRILRRCVQRLLHKRKVIMKSKNFLDTCTKYDFLNTEKYFCC